MESLINKVSEYNIFNNLFVGAVGFLTCKIYFNVILDDILLLIFTMYFIGMTINRIGSLILVHFLEKIKFISKVKYPEYIEASKVDKKIDILNQERNIYRSLFTLGIIMLLLECVSLFYDISKTPIIIPIMFITILYGFSFRKQNTYVVERVKKARKK